MNTHPFTVSTKPGVFDRYLTRQEEAALFRAVKSHRSVLARRDYHWMKFLRYTGIRVGSLSLYSVGDALKAIREGRLNMRPEILKGGLIYEKNGPHKGQPIGVNKHKGYNRLLNTEAEKALKGLLRVRKKMGHAPTDGHPLVMSRHGKGMSIRSYQHRMKLWVEKAGIDVPATPHYFRHTAARRIMENSTARNPLEAVQKTLNHASIRTTEIYTAMSRADMDQAMLDLV